MLWNPSRRVLETGDTREDHRKEPRKHQDALVRESTRSDASPTNLLCARMSPGEFKGQLQSPGTRLWSNGAPQAPMRTQVLKHAALRQALKSKNCKPLEVHCGRLTGKKWIMALTSKAAEARKDRRSASTVDDRMWTTAH